jgi:hypothetical protein
MIRSGAWDDVPGRTDEHAVTRAAAATSALRTAFLDTGAA